MEREQAEKRIKARRDFWWHAGTYIIINGLLVAIWALSGGGGFWPVWTMLGWGVGLAFHGLATFLGNRVTEADVRREMQRGR